MSSPKFILALDQGTTSSRAIIFDHNAKIICCEQKEFQQYYPQPGWVKHDPIEIWQTQLSVAKQAIAKANIHAAQIAAIGITNQRETTVVWDRKTGDPIYSAIVWQDRRTADFCEALKKQNLETQVQYKTGLVLDPYFSATKIKWILDNVDGARKRADNGELAFGTMDSWLVWNLTEGKTHIADATNASRTLLFNIRENKWDDDLLKLFGIPESLLPHVVDPSGEHAVTQLFGAAIPICSLVGDQQAALFGQACFTAGNVKNTYGTGCFLLMHIGEQAVTSKHRLLTTIANRAQNKIEYALEGSVFNAGAAVQWLRDGLGIIEKSSDVEALALQVESSEGVYVVPAFSGLGAPQWDANARGLIIGLTRGTTKAHIARATLEGIAFQVNDVLQCMAADCGKAISSLKVDGGGAKNNLLMQLQADLIQAPIERSNNVEATALGAAFMAGLACGFWSSRDELRGLLKTETIFQPQRKDLTAEKKGWQRALQRSANWH